MWVHWNNSCVNTTRDKKTGGSTFKMLNRFSLFYTDNLLQFNSNLKVRGFDKINYKEKTCKLQQLQLIVGVNHVYYENDVIKHSQRNWTDINSMLLEQHRLHNAHTLLISGMKEWSSKLVINKWCWSVHNW